MKGFYKGIIVRGAVTLSPPLNLYLLAAAVIRKGHSPLIFDYNTERDGDAGLIRSIKEFKPDHLCITLRSPNISWGTRLARTLKRIFPHLKIVAGGPHPSAMPEEVMGSQAFDFVIQGEGEESLPLLLDDVPFGDIEGLFYREDCTLKKGRSRRFISDLDSLPFPAWDLADLSAYRRPGLVSLYPPVADLETTRGCPFGCIYCSKAVFGHRFRKKGLERCIDEIEWTLRRGFKSINFVDDTFNFEEERALLFCEEILRRGVKFRWTLTNGIRIDMAGKSLFNELRRAGCYLVAFGFETADREVLKGVDKKMELEMAEYAVREANRNKMITVGYFMLGLPGEREESIKETLRFAKRARLDYAKWSFTVPLPATPLFRMWKGYIKPGTEYNFNIHSPMEDYFTHPERGWDDLERVRRRCYRGFYLDPGYIVRRLSRGVEQGTIAMDLLQFTGGRFD